jgi:hypothetical protein
MIELVLLAAVGAALFIAFVGMGLKGAPRHIPDSSTVAAMGEMVRLEGVSFPNAGRLFDDREYQMLCSNPYLQQVAKRFRKERQELAIQWISILLADLNTLWAFRRFLIRHGAPAHFREELDIMQTFVISVALLYVLRILVHAFGPYALSSTTRNARHLVDKMSYATAGVLSRIPPARLADVQRNWTQTAA